MKIRLIAAAVFLFIVAVISFDFDAVDAQKTSPETIVIDEFAASLGLRSVGELRGRSSAADGVEEISFNTSKAKAFVWTERLPNGSALPFFAVSLDGENLAKVATVDNELKLRYATFDPLVDTPVLPEGFAAESQQGRGAYIVQFKTQALDEYRSGLRAEGADIFTYLPNNAYIVQMDSSALLKVSSLPYVRWVGRYQPAYKLDEQLLGGLVSDELKTARYNIMLLERGPRMQSKLAGEIVSKGGEIHLTQDEGFRIEATLSPAQLADALRSEDVLFIDEWSAPENDMDVVRTVGGANFVETTLGFRGEGVRAEVMDNGLRQTHGDFNSGLAPLIHNSANTSEPSNHGSSTYGINFGRGTTNPAGRGMLPEAQGIFADYDFLSNRYTHTAQLNQSPYFAVYQSNSWGSSLTTAYTTISAEMDDILFVNDFLLLNSQSNAGSQQSRPQAWAKNVVSIGGIRHFNTASFTDDRWNGGASVGPAADGRIKPDLANFYDSVFTTSNGSDTSYTTGFGGTSAATPITAGHFGIFYQMWHNGLFGNPTAGTVFDSRPHMTTAKAVMMNTAVQWDMTIAGTDTTRVRQGFGRANVENLYNLRNKMRIINETDVLTALQTRNYVVAVPPGSTDPLKITMAYADPMGSPGATRARVNDLTLRVTSPSGVVYWGNVGLGVGGGMWSTSGGSANIVDTVENVFIQSPEAGRWSISVIASELNQDGRLETPGFVDADYALVASGVVPVTPTTPNVTVSGRVISSGGSGRGNALLTMRDVNGVERQTYSNTFGYFYFDEVPVGQTFVLSAYWRKRDFQQVEIIITTKDNIENLEFVTVE
jgi:serine protease AprX